MTTHRRKTARLARIGAMLSAAAATGTVAEVLRRYRRDLRRARARIACDSRIAQTTLGPIEYSSAGEGPPVLVVHGAGGGFDQGLDLGRALAPKGFRVIAVSRFGYLRTPLPSDATAESQADAHAALLDALGIRSAAVLGGSAGAPSSVQLALRHPDRVDALILGVPALYLFRRGREATLRTPTGIRFLFDTALRSDFLFWASLRLAHRTLIRTILGTPPEVVDGASPAEKARVEEMLEHILPVTERRLGLINDAAVTTHLERYPVERLEIPTLVIGTADDLYGTYDAARFTSERVPNARFLSFPTGGHLWVGHHEEVTSAIAAFLAEAMGRQPSAPSPAVTEVLSSTC